MITGMYDEFKRIYKNLCANFQKPLDKDLCEFWFEELEPFDIDELKKTFRNIIAKDRFFPNLNRIYEELKKIQFKEVDEYQKGARFEEKNIRPIWYGKEIRNEEIDYDTQCIASDFENFLSEIRK